VLDKRRDGYWIGISTHDHLGNEVITYPKPLRQLTDGKVVKCFTAIDKKKKTQMAAAAECFEAYCEDNRVLYEKLKSEYDKRNEDAPEPVPEPKKEIRVIPVKNFAEILDTVKKLVGDDLVDIYRICATVIVSMQYADTESLYFIILAPPGSGKSTVVSFFKSCSGLEWTDTTSINGLDPGTANSEQESISLLDIAANKTLAIHDLTAVFSNDQAMVKKIKSVFENIYGEEGFKKQSPGSGLRTYGKRLNLIFGVHPRSFWEKYRGTDQRMGLDLISTERYIYAGIKERDHFSDYIAGKIVTQSEKERIAAITANFLDNLAPIEIVISTEDRVLITNKISKFFNDLDKKTKLYKKGTETRRLKQCEMFCKASACLDGRGKINESDVNLYVKCLTLPDYRPEEDEPGEATEETEESPEDEKTTSFSEVSSPPSQIERLLSDVNYKND
jgi:hypothetical protein